ncbi:MAG TPA: hypothetical protein DIV79_05975 [Opitutae bacterium]|nr:hypothetical protein [Opitutaceae bacterium]HCR29547.1 hypothetical protein [Opitutae bacterium]
MSPHGARLSSGKCWIIGISSELGPAYEDLEGASKCVDPDDFYPLLSAAFSKNAFKHIVLPL